MKLPKSFGATAIINTLPKADTASLLQLSELPDRSYLFGAHALHAAIETNKFLKAHNTHEVDICLAPKSGATFSIRDRAKNMDEYELAKGGIDKINMQSASKQYIYLAEFGVIRALYHLLHTLPPETLESVTVSVPGLYPAPQNASDLYDDLTKKHPLRLAEYIQEVDLRKNNAGVKASFKKEVMVTSSGDTHYPAPLDFHDPLPAELPPCIVYGGWTKPVASQPLYFQWFPTKLDAETAVANAFGIKLEDITPPNVVSSYVKEIDAAIAANQDYFDRYNIDVKLSVVEEIDEKNVLQMNLTNKNSRKYCKNGFLNGNALENIRELNLSGFSSCVFLVVNFNFLREFIRHTPPEADSIFISSPLLFGKELVPIQEAYSRMHRLIPESAAAMLTYNQRDESLQFIRDKEAIIKTHRIEGLIAPEDARNGSHDDTGIELYGGWVKEAETSIIRGKSLRNIFWVNRWFANGNEAIAEVAKTFNTDTDLQEQEENSTFAKTLDAIPASLTDPYYRALTQLNAASFDYPKSIASLPTSLEELVERSQQLRKSLAHTLEVITAEPSDKLFLEIVQQAETIALIRSYLTQRHSKNTTEEGKLLKIAAEASETFLRAFHENGGSPDRFELLFIHRQTERIRAKLCETLKLAPTKFIAQKITLDNATFDDVLKLFELDGDDVRMLQFGDAAGGIEGSEIASELYNTIEALGSGSPDSISTIDVLVKLLKVSAELSQNSARKASLVARCDAALSSLEDMSSVEKFPDNLLIEATALSALIKESSFVDAITRKSFALRHEQTRVRITQAFDNAKRELEKQTPKDKSFKPEHAEREDKRLAFYFRALDKFAPLQTRKVIFDKTSHFMATSSDIASSFTERYFVP